MTRQLDKAQRRQRPSVPCADGLQSHLSRLWRALLSPASHVALQFIAGQALVNLFVLVRHLSFAQVMDVQGSLLPCLCHMLPCRALSETPHVLHKCDHAGL